MCIMWLLWSPCSELSVIPNTTPREERSLENQNGKEGEISGSSVAKLVEESRESVQSLEGPKNVEYDLHGDWMIVSRKKCNPILGKDKFQKGACQH